MHIVKMIAGKYQLSNGQLVTKDELPHAMHMNEDAVKKQEAQREQIMAQAERYDREQKKNKRK